MIMVGESIILKNGDDSVTSFIEKISKDGRFILIIDERNLLKDNLTYRMAVMKRGGVVIGEGIVVKVKEHGRDGTENDGLAEYVIKITRPFAKKQNRNAYRLNCDLPIKIITYEKSDFGNPKIYNAHISNISAGGARILTNGKISGNDVINMSMTLGNAPMEILGIVIDSNKNQDMTTPYQYVLRVRFTHITEKDDERITKFIFEEFRKERKRQIHKESQHNEEQTETKKNPSRK